MNVYLSEEEQVEQIKEWFKKYGYSILTGVALGLAVMYGWQYWSKHKIEQGQAASQAYSQVMQSFDSNEMETTLAQAENIQAEYPDSAYATMTQFLLADQAVVADKLDDAKTALLWIVENSKTKPFQQIARLRVARILVAQNQMDAALDILATIDDAAFSMQSNEIRGDILLAQGKEDAAKQAYQTAIEANPESAATRPILTVKLNNVGLVKGEVL